MIPTLLLAITVTFSPAKPAVGDRITIDFPAPAAVDASPEYDVIQQGGRRAIVRTFVPRPFVLTGRVGNEPFRLTVPVQSVLRPNDDLKPAPLVPPRTTPYPLVPFLLIGGAVAAAIAAWTALWLRTRTKKVVVTPSLPADEQFRRAVAAARKQRLRWAALADATRSFLAATRPAMGIELTTRELLPRLRPAERGLIEEILRNGDLEKFAPWGARATDAGFEEAAQDLLEWARPRLEVAA
jgi:hypothetical protein